MRCAVFGSFYLFLSKELCAAVRYEFDPPRELSYLAFVVRFVCHCFEGGLQVVFKLLSIVLKFKSLVELYGKSIKLA
jgi:hypothetical protein